MVMFDSEEGTTRCPFIAVHKAPLASQQSPRTSPHPSTKPMTRHCGRSTFLPLSSTLFQGGELGSSTFIPEHGGARSRSLFRLLSQPPMVLEVSVFLFLDVFCFSGQTFVFATMNFVFLPFDSLFW
jgi:hypothetical protein